MICTSLGVQNSRNHPGSGKSASPPMGHWRSRKNCALIDCFVLSKSELRQMVFFSEPCAPRLQTSANHITRVVGGQVGRPRERRATWQSSIFASELIVKLRHTLIVSVLPFVSIAALAADPSDTGTLSHASVRASVVAARAAHQLRPAGDAADYDRPNTSRTSTLTRADVEKEVREARANGELIPSGEAQSYEVAQGPSTWDRSRADVKAEVLAARANGELVPAGEGQPLGAETTTASRQSLQRFAAALRKLRTAE